MPKKLEPLPLTDGIRSGVARGVNGLDMHYLEAGDIREDRPVLLLLHGFPELAYSWRKVMPRLAEAGYRVLAPDQRGYGRTEGWDRDYDGDLASFRFLNLVRDALGLLASLGISSVHGVVGHDFGSWVAAYCALVRPDVFRSAVMMSAPFSGPPALAEAGSGGKPEDIHAALAALERPRKHYHAYYCTRAANPNMHQCPQGVHDFLRAYFHYKSADWEGNTPFRLAAWSAPELARMPTYYIMDLDRGMAETAAEFMPSQAQIDACEWLRDDELAVYAAEYARNGFQGGLQWYRCRSEDRLNRELQLFAGRSIDVPSAFISGASDWGVYQSPGAIDTMQTTACSDLRLFELLPGAGHWVQQEQAAAVAERLVGFFGDV